LGKGQRLTLVSDKPKTGRTYAGEPLECRTCNNRDLIETHQPRHKGGKIIKGKASWLCPYCQRIVWP